MIPSRIKQAALARGIRVEQPEDVNAPPALELISGEAIARFAGTTGYPAGYTPASPPLDGPILPERSHYFDIGAEHVFLPGLKLGVDAFYKLAQDLIDEGRR